MYFNRQQKSTIEHYRGQREKEPKRTKQGLGQKSWDLRRMCISLYRDQPMIAAERAENLPVITFHSKKRGRIN